MCRGSTGSPPPGARRGMWQVPDDARGPKKQNTASYVAEGPVLRPREHEGG